MLTDSKSQRSALCKASDSSSTLTHDLILLQVDSLQFRQGGQLLWEVLKLVPGQVNGLEVLEAADLVGEAMEVVAFQVELCHRREEGEIVREGEPSRGHQSCCQCSGQEDSENDITERPQEDGSRSVCPNLCPGPSAIILAEVSPLWLCKRLS